METPLNIVYSIYNAPGINGNDWTRFQEAIVTGISHCMGTTMLRIVSRIDPPNLLHQILSNS